MEKRGAVSLWVGTATSPAALETYLTAEYTDDGDTIPSQFATDFSIKWFDEDFREAATFEPPTRSLSAALAGFSYDNTMTPRFIEQSGETLMEDVNAVVLLYNFAYGGGVSANSSDDVQLRFMGVVSYR